MALFKPLQLGLKPLLLHPGAWFLGLLTGLLGFSLLQEEALGASIQELSRIFFLLVSLITPPFLAWITHRALAPDFGHEAFQATPRNDFLRLVFKLSVAGLIALCFGGLGLLGASLIAFHGEEWHLVIDEYSAIYFVFTVLSLFFWIAMSAVVCSYVRSWVGAIGIAGFAGIVLWLLPFLLLNALQWHQAAPVLLRVSPLSPLYPLMPYAWLSPSLPWGLAPEWLWWNRVWMLGCALLFLCWTLLKQVGWRRASPKATLIVLGSIGGVLTATALLGLMASWQNVIAPYTVVDLLKGKAHMEAPFTFDAFGRPLLLKGPLGTIFVDIRSPQATLPAWIGDEETLVKYGLIGFLPSQNFSLPWELKSQFGRFSLMLKRAFWVPGNERLYVLPRQLVMGLVPNPHINLNSYSLFQASQGSGWAISEGFLQDKNVNSTDLWRSASQLAELLPLNSAGRDYAALYLLEPLAKETNERFRTLLAQSVELIPSNLKTHFGYLSPYSPPALEQQQAYQEIADRWSDSVKQRADIPYVLQLQALMAFRPRYTGMGLSYDPDRLDELASKRGYSEEQTLALLQTISEILLDFSSADQNALKLHELPKKLQVEHLAQALSQRVSWQLDDARVFIEELLSFATIDAPGPSTSKETEAINQQLVALDYASPSDYEAWLILEYWRRGEAMGHEAFLRAELERYTASQEASP